MNKTYPTIITGLRSPAEKLGGLVYFGRMIDKIRLQAAGKLPDEWVKMLGDQHKGGFDFRCCSFLNISHWDLTEKVLSCGDDLEILEWVFEHGRRPSQEEMDIWNAFMSKRGWRDEASQRLTERLAEIGLKPNTVETFFEFIDLDEGRITL